MTLFIVPKVIAPVTLGTRAFVDRPTGLLVIVQIDLQVTGWQHTIKRMDMSSPIPATDLIDAYGRIEDRLKKWLELFLVRNCGERKQVAS